MPAPGQRASEERALSTQGSLEPVQSPDFFADHSHLDRFLTNTRDWFKSWTWNKRSGPDGRTRQNSSPDRRLPSQWIDQQREEEERLQRTAMPSDALSEPTVGHDGTDEERVQRQAEEQHDIPANVVREGPSHEIERPSPSPSHSARPSLGPSRSNSTPQINVGPSDPVVERFAPTITVGTSNNERLLAPHKAEDQRTPCSKGSHA